MAPLKRDRTMYQQFLFAQGGYPWLRGHGSIEAMSTGHTNAGSEIQLYPWLRGHGSIEASKRTSLDARLDRRGYPWLRGHGSIEASDGNSRGVVYYAAQPGIHG